MVLGVKFDEELIKDGFKVQKEFLDAVFSIELWALARALIKHQLYDFSYHSMLLMVIGMGSFA